MAKKKSIKCNSNKAREEAIKQGFLKPKKRKKGR